MIDKLKEEIINSKLLEEELNALFCDVNFYVGHQTSKLKKLNDLFHEELVKIKQSETKLKELNKYLSLTIETVPISIYKRKVDKNFAFIFLSKDIQNITGYSDEDFFNNENLWIDCIHLDDRNLFLENIVNLSPTRKRFEIDYRFKVANNYYKWFRDIAKLIKDGDNYYVIGGVRDITQKKIIENDLKSSEERFRFLAENSPDVIYHYKFKPINKFESISPAVLNILGYPPIDFYQNPDLIRDIVHPDDRILFNNLILANEKKIKLPVIRFIRKDKSIIFTEHHIKVIRHKNNELVSIEGIAMDITHRIEKEKSQKMFIKDLEKSNKELADFAFVVSHDLKAPLNTCGLIIELLSKECNKKMSSREKKLFDNLNTAVTKMYSLIDGILQYSKVGLEENKLELVDINNILSDLIILLNPPKNVNIKIGS